MAETTAVGPEATPGGVKTPGSGKSEGKVIPAIYSELGSEIRHYSTIRTTLTTFLITVAITGFSTFFEENRMPFLALAGFVFSAAAPILCLYFSFNTEKAIIRYRRARTLLGNDSAGPDQVFGTSDQRADDRKAARREMWRDKLNWILIVGDLLLIAAFIACWIFLPALDVE
jgi:hypothetical protein